MTQKRMAKTCELRSVPQAADERGSQPVTPVPWAALARFGGGGRPAAAPPGDRTQVSRSPARAGRAPLGLLVVASPDRNLLGAFFPVSPTGATFVGRGADASVRVDDSGISRLHLRIAMGEGGAFVAEDQRSSNGTHVNGQRVHSAVLGEGDRIQLGAGTQLLFGRQTGTGTEEIRLRRALAAAGAGAWEWTPASGALALSGGMARELANSADTTEPCPEDYWSLVQEEDRAALRAGLEEALETGERCELECRFVRRDGGIAWVAFRGDVVRDAAGAGVRITGTAMDVTGRKRAEDEMRRQSLLLDSLSDGVVALDFDGTVLDWNARAEQIFGFSRAEVRGRRLDDVFGCADEMGAALVARARAGDRAPEERLLRRKNGSEVALEVTSLPLRDGDGGQLACVAVLRDVDERRRMASQLQVAERLASLGTLAAGVAHEIYNPLAFMKSNLHWLRGQVRQLAGAAVGEWKDVEAALADCALGADRIHAIVQDLKAHTAASAQGHGSGATGDEAFADPNAAMEFALRIAECELRPTASVHRDLRPVPAVRCGRVQLGQLFLNLLLNAAQAIPAGAVEVNTISVRSRHDVVAGVAVFEVEDTGTGIPPDVMKRMFDPFYTTKPVGKGTGLGLFICHSIVSAVGGEISVESEVGRGSTFRVALPVAERGRGPGAPAR